MITLMAAATVWAGSSMNSLATVAITGADQGLVSQLPGSATDYDFGNFGGVYASTFGTTYVGAKDLTDFSATALNQYADGGQSTILSPAGVSIHTGMTYSFTSGDLNLATFTLGSSPTFNYADFNVFVLYSNAPGYGGLRDASFSLAQGNSATGAGATVVAVTDTNTDKTMGRVVEFNIKGATAGEEFAIAATGRAGDGEEIGGIAFQQVAVPEPSDYALVGLGLAVLLALGRIRRLASKTQPL